MTGGVATPVTVEGETVMSSTTKSAAQIGADTECPHDELSPLGLMGTASLFQCDVCAGVIVSW
jgi:hypothetical protein